MLQLLISPNHLARTAATVIYGHKPSAQELSAGGTGEITVTTKNGNSANFEASPEVIDEILRLKVQGQIAWGDFVFKSNASETNLKLKCVEYFPISKEEDQEERGP